MITRMKTITVLLMVVITILMMVLVLTSKMSTVLFGGADGREDDDVGDEGRL